MLLEQHVYCTRLELSFVVQIQWFFCSNPLLSPWETCLLGARLGDDINFWLFYTVLEIFRYVWIMQM